MVRRVMDVRNRIVANEYGIQLRNSPQYTAERLKDIHPDTLNERGLDNTFVETFLPFHRCRSATHPFAFVVGTKLFLYAL